MPRDSITARLADLRAIHTPEGVEVLEPIEVSGSTQWLSIRGLNRANPILLVLHGGPGSPVMGMAWAYQSPGKISSRWSIGTAVASARASPPRTPPASRRR